MFGERILQKNAVYGISGIDDSAFSSDKFTHVIGISLKWCSKC